MRVGKAFLQVALIVVMTLLGCQLVSSQKPLPIQIPLLKPDLSEPGLDVMIRFYKVDDFRSPAIFLGLNSDDFSRILFIRQIDSNLGLYRILNAQTFDDPIVRKIKSLGNTAFIEADGRVYKLKK